MNLGKQCIELIDARDHLSEAERVARLLDLAWEYTISEHPEAATQFGYPGHNHSWTDSTFEAIERRGKGHKRLLDVAESIDSSQLSLDVRLDYELIRKSIEWSVEGARFHGEYLPFTPFGGPEARVAQVVAITPATTAVQYDDIQARLEAIPAVVEQTIALMEKGISQGIVSPKAVLAKAAEQIGNQIVKDPLESPLLKNLNVIPSDISETKAERLRAAAVETYTQRIRPAYERLREFVVQTYLPACRESIALTDLPNGEDWYAFEVRRYTTTDLSPKEIHEIGVDEVARIRSLMLDAKSAAGFEGSLEDFFVFLRDDPQFFFEESEELLRTYRDICKRADPELAKLFGNLPRLPYGVRPVPDFLERTAPTAYYQPGTLQAGRPGYFYANTYDLSARPKWEMEALSLHEAVPGHHLQISIAQELDGIHEFRKHGFWTAYVEGWGLYAESLGSEMGFYKDPYSKFGQLTYEMWRAIRLVVDTGMHAFGWSREQSIDFFKQNAGKAEHDIVVEVDRYIAWPGQALAYKIGELRLKELRSLAIAELGDAFDLRTFHDQLLGRGALPLDVLEVLMKEWISGQEK